MKTSDANGNFHFRISSQMLVLELVVYIARCGVVPQPLKTRYMNGSLLFRTLFSETFFPAQNITIVEL